MFNKKGKKKSLERLRLVSDDAEEHPAKGSTLHFCSTFRVCSVTRRGSEMGRKRGIVCDAAPSLGKV